MIVAYLADGLGEYLLADGVSLLVQAFFAGIFIVLAMIVGMLLIIRGIN